MTSYALVCLQLRGTLTVTNETELQRLPSDTKKKGFKFELKTLSPNGDNKINRFKVGTAHRLIFMIYESWSLRCARGVFVNLRGTSVKMLFTRK